MHEVIDIYTKLVIAIISFVAPLIIHLLSMFSEALIHVKRRTQTQIKLFESLANKSFQKEGIKVAKTIADSYEKQLKSLNRDVNLLSPKRQIRRIFPTLLSALVFLVLFHLGKSEKWLENPNFFVRNLFFILSFMCAFLGVIFLKNVAWKVIEIKQELAEINDKSREKTDELSLVNEEE